MNADKIKDIEKDMERVIQMRMKDIAATFAESLELNDPEIATWLSTRLAELAIVLQHAPPTLGAKVILMLLNMLPDHEVAEVIRQYVDRISERYKTIQKLKYE